MSCAPLVIKPGFTFEYAFFWADPDLVYRTVTGLSLAAPCVLTVPGHDVPDGWPFRLESIKGPCDLNSDPTDPASFYVADVIDADSIAINDLNTTRERPMQGEAVLAYYRPADTTGLTARFDVSRGDEADTVFSTAATVEGGLISIRLTAQQTMLIPRQGRFSLTLYDPVDEGVVYQVAAGQVVSG